MLRVIFGFLGLLVVLAIVSSLAKTQLGALGQFNATTSGAASPSGSDGAATGGGAGGMAGRLVGESRPDGIAATAGAEMPTAQQQIQGVQQSVRDRTADALRQGVQRNQRAQP